MSRALSLRRSINHLLHRRLPSNPISSASTFPPHHPINPTRTFCTSSPSPAPASSEAELRRYLGYTALIVFCGAATYFSFPFSENAKHKKAQLFRYAPLPDDLHTVSNWSGTHEVQTRNFHQPENLEELEKLVKDSDEKKVRIRPVGSGLSPNGIGLSRVGMVNLALMDRVLEVDKEKKQVRVQAGIRVQQLVDGIKEYGLTLQNFASIREQQIGGIVQVGAHGTGARLPPIDEQVISMKLVTPGQGTIEISKEKDPELFHLARCGLGGLGVVAEVTLQCVDRQELVEHTYVTDMNDIKKNHKKLLSENKHVKYLYIPYTDVVVVVTCNPISKWWGPPKFTPKYTKDEAIQHVRDLYKESLERYRINELSFTELRDKLIALDPLKKEHIWVSETCFPAGSLTKPSMKDLEYIEELKRLIEKRRLPAPGPIEQRWTACSQSYMSPAFSSNKDDIFSWVGIIMYLPTTDGRQRKDITDEFFHYRRLTQTELWDKYGAYEHWAKIELPRDKDDQAALRERLRKRFPVDAYNAARKRLDPNRIFSNNKLEKLFPLSEAV
ncbi:L-galactono-1,4-lactone dehydrogenase, mitochondrial [Linum grandiflorum]